MKPQESRTTRRQDKSKIVSDVLLFEDKVSEWVTRKALVMFSVSGSFKAKYSREWKLGRGGQFREKRVIQRNYLISETRGSEAAWVWLWPLGPDSVLESQV